MGHLRIEVPGQPAESALTVSHQWLPVPGTPLTQAFIALSVDAVTAAVSSSLTDVSQLLPHAHLRVDGGRAPYAHGKLPSHGFRLYNVWQLPGDDKLRPDNVSPLIHGAQRLGDDCLCLLA
jgi:hypothetical protein